MSSFSDTFTKNQEQEELLNYDDSASYYFGATVLLCILIPWTWTWIKYYIWGASANLFPEKSFKDGSTYRYCRNGVMETNLGRIEALEAKCLKKNRNFLKLGMLGLLWVAWLTCVGQICLNSEGLGGGLKSFNPYDILDLQVGVSDEKEIKKAYRTQSLKYHPDKNPDDPHAAAKFILVAKAHKALTDPVARTNYEKFGNPDGPQTTKVGIGLPRFLLEKKNHLIILIIFFVVFLIIIPATFIYHYQSQRDYSPNGVRVETLQFFGHFITEQTKIKNCPELLAASAESRSLQMGPSDEAEMKPVLQEIQDTGSATAGGGKGKNAAQQRFDMPIIVRNKNLLLAHMQRLHQLLTPNLRLDLDELLRSSDKVMNSMIEIACVREWLTTAQAMIEFRRCLIQGLDVRSSSLLQIPHFTEESVKHCLKGASPIKDLATFLARDPSARRGVANLNEEQLADIDAFCAHMTQVELELKAEVEGETHICRDDIATIHVKLTRKQLKVGEALGHIHAPFWPDLKEEEWFIFLLDGGKPITYTKIKSSDRVLKEKIQFQVGRKGKHALQVMAMCDCYAGIDKTAKVEFDALDPEDPICTSDRKIYVHPEDQTLEEHPSMFMTIMGNLQEGDEESEDEDEKEEKEAEKKKEGKKADDGSDSDSSSSSDSSSDSDSDSDNDDDKSKAKRTAAGRAKK